MTPPHKYPRSSCRDAGFSLVELTVALGVMGYCLLAIFGLLPVGITSNRNSVATTEAVGVASSVLSDVRAVAAKGTSRFNIASLGAGSQTLYFAGDGTYNSDSSAPETKYRAEVTTTADASDSTLYWVRVVVSWPASANPGKAATFSALTAVSL